MCCGYSINTGAALTKVGKSKQRDHRGSQLRLNSKLDEGKYQGQRIVPVESQEKSDCTLKVNRYFEPLAVKVAVLGKEYTPL